MLKLGNITFDCENPARVAEFWGAALGYNVEKHSEDFAVASNPDGSRPYYLFIKVPEPRTVKNRMHVDIRVAGKGPWDLAERERLIRAKVPTLVAAGATVVREEHYDDALGHVVMLDPEGNEFCVG